MKVQGSLAQATTTLLHHQQQQQYSPYLWNVAAVSQQQHPQTSGFQPMATPGFIQQRQTFDQSTAMKLHYYVVATSFDQNWYKVINN